MLLPQMDNYIDAVKLLTLDKGCHPGCRDCNSNTPLHNAAAGGYLKVVKFFITKLNCNPTIPGENGLRLFMLQQRGTCGHNEMFILIDSAKCNPSQVNNHNKATALHYAAGRGQL